jgi:hypothetical protein
MTEYCKIVCELCKGTYLDTPSHKTRHSVSNKHRLAEYKKQDTERILRETQRLYKIIK